MTRLKVNILECGDWNGEMRVLYYVSIFPYRIPVGKQIKTDDIGIITIMDYLYVEEVLEHFFN